METIPLLSIIVFLSAVGIIIFLVLFFLFVKMIDEMGWKKDGFKSKGVIHK